MAKKKAKKLKESLLRSWDSPIELMLRNAIVEFVDHEKQWSLMDYSTSKEQAKACETPHGIEIVPMDEDLVDTDHQAYGAESAKLERLVWMYGSVRAWSYKLDLALECRNQFLVVECDGHDYHDRTKQQASSDRARDRFLLSKNVHTIRFTGSDIFRDANECAVETMRLMAQLVDANSLARRIGEESGVRRAVMNIEKALPVSNFQVPEEHW
jgi:hypothetical protein